MRKFIYDGVVAEFTHRAITGKRQFRFTDGGRFQNMTAAAEVAARLTISGIAYEFGGDLEKGLTIKVSPASVLTEAEAEALLHELSCRPSMRGVR